MKLREEEFYDQYHQHGGTTIIPTEIFNELYDDATEEIERLHSIIKEATEYIENNKQGTDCCGEIYIGLGEKEINDILIILDKENNNEDD